MDEKEYAYRGLQAQAMDIQQQLQSLQALMAECSAAGKALENLKSDAIFPIGSGVLVPATTRGGKVLVEIGAGLVAEKTREEARAILKAKAEKLEYAFGRAEAALKEAARRMAELESSMK
ncbi:prefoldin subunit alpha [Candidatus Micrarchaeota archaeon CG_4_10_14_0_2_um_filter_60_11]|nr:MAG: prefoldin subunit alpha [Candidatus Micrarchaeota archaeon CG1_02_60_51]PIN95769.1 MAG: prefoldin subunit alpha [Candidatus Micrarchaeota archaeon CG10_big_fil_rev_8_21_14_0_10_60_32]PIO01792.1 MAG: prefoldin subunit alpha [Candidatus Micrarchaeota archaeon CG09_land_8_20_14_0_10_60_16]PIY91429.1 MAG: prefoldin subunit alpha [Candidatus Micrarchaeota archaeon CG_4_10_14_0_8_um_filter_60_7]PIZ91187.1 MAG: prefoldin subunit alpha [Candidatus Micrarchaeota archaeon CG_4_10_14_0_2_um_filter